MASPLYTPPMPPDLPAIAGMNEQLAQYLRTFSLWCRNGFNNKVTLGVAAPSLLLSAYDTPPGATPKVFIIQVDSAGTLMATPVPIGGKQ